MLSAMALHNVKPHGYGLVSHIREGQYGKRFPPLHIQTMPRKDIPITCDKDSATTLPIAKFIRHGAFDSLLEIFYVSDDPCHPGDMSVIGPRPQMPEQVNLIDLMAQNDLQDKQLFNTWNSAKPYMRPGMWSSASMVSETYRSGSMDFHRECMKRDIWYYHNGCLAVDMTIFFSTLVTGVQRSKITPPNS